MSQPRPLSRRQVLHTAGLLGIAAAGTGTMTAAAASAGLEGSGLVTGQMKPLKYEAIPGLLTKEQVAPHYQAHYGGALKRFVALEQQLEAQAGGEGQPGDDAWKFAQRDRLNRMNSVLLHELYFDNLAPQPPQPAQDIRAALAERFGSLERWAEDFRACAMAAAGWAILARDLANGRLYNVTSDVHEVGVLWLGQPLVVCDVYEHAFYVDYQNRKQAYVDKFVEFLDWDEIDRRYQLLAG